VFSALKFHVIVHVTCCAEHNVSAEKVVVKVIEAGEAARTKFTVTKTKAPLEKQINGPPPIIEEIPPIVEKVTDRKGVASTVHRDYKFEEMFLEHPDLFSIKDKLKELVSGQPPPPSHQQPATSRCIDVHRLSHIWFAHGVVPG
jgi:hypothetical protein